MKEKIKTISQILQIVRKLRKQGEKIVFTNGCFDILHIGHFRYLNKADQYGKLIVGLNSDKSVKKNKGPNRPINNEKNRAQMLASLSCVSYVFIFNDKTVEGLLKKIKPEIYIKGGDYTLDTVNQDERKIIENYGGKIKIIPAQRNTSTTAIIKKIESLE